MQLNNKVALVTSSRQGICASTAKQLAAAGAKVMICGRNAIEGRATVAQIQQSGGRARFILTDITLPADVQAAIDETIATYGRLDILFNAVSSQYTQDGGLLDVSETTWDRVTENTLKGTFLCCQYAIPFLQNSGYGSIINLIEPAADDMHTVASICQGGLVAMTCAIAQQFPATHISANVIWACPSLSPPLNGLITEKILYAPLSERLDTSESASTVPFANIADTVMYLATEPSAAENNQLHGYILMVTSSAS